MFTSINQAINASLTKRSAKDEKGFTLIELLVVVLIIGILAAIAIPVFIGQQNKAKDSAAQSDLGNAKTAVISIETNNSGTFPAAFTATDLKANGFTPTSGTSGFTILGTLSAFCIQETSATSSTSNFYITDSSGATSGTCPATPYGSTNLYDSAH